MSEGTVVLRTPSRQRLEHASVLVTGAGGFIGSVTVRALIEHGATVTALVGPPGQPAISPPPGVRSLVADIADDTAICDLAAGADVIVHLAGPPAVGASFERATEYARVHVLVTVSVLEACRRARVHRLVHVSSAEVYGEAEDARVIESRPLRPRSPYAAAKAAGEQFVHAFVHAFGLQTVILRPFSVYGPGQRPTSLVGTIIDQALHAGEIVVADLRPIRDYCFVADVVEAIVHACVADLPPRCTLNLGTGLGTSVGDVARLAVAFVGKGQAVRQEPSRRRPPDAEIFHLVADTSRARALLGWEARTSLESGLERTIRSAQTP